MARHWVKSLDALSYLILTTTKESTIIVILILQIVTENAKSEQRASDRNWGDINIQELDKGRGTCKETWDQEAKEREGISRTAVMKIKDRLPKRMTYSQVIGMWQSWDMNPSYQAPTPICFIIAFRCFYTCSKWHTWGPLSTTFMRFRWLSSIQKKTKL